MAAHRGARNRRLGSALLVATLLIGGLAVTVVAGIPASAATVHTRMGPGQPLRAGASLSSANGFVTLTMQTDGDLVARAGTQLLWTSHTTGRGNFAQVQSSGNLGIFSSSNRMLWATRTRGAGSELTVQNTGDLTLTTGARLLWHSRTLARVLRVGVHLGPGQFVTGAGGEKIIMQTDGNLVVYRGAVALWATSTYIARSYAIIQTDGNFVVFTPQRRSLWNSHTSGVGNGALLFVSADGDVQLVNAAGRTVWRSYTMRVQTAAQLAVRLLGLWGSKVSGTPDARADLVATSHGQTVASPCGGRVGIDIRVVRFLVQVTSRYRIKINNIVTGHGCDSGGHPKGRATDLGSATDLTTRTFTSFGGVAGADNPAVDRAFVNYISTILPNGAGLGQSNCPGRSGTHLRAGVQFFADFCNHQHIQVQPSR